MFSAEELVRVVSEEELVFDDGSLPVTVSTTSHSQKGGMEGMMATIMYETKVFVTGGNPRYTVYTQAYSTETAARRGHKDIAMFFRENPFFAVMTAVRE